jgi:hypothetical protein
MEFPLNPHKKNQRSEGISQEKNGRDPLGGTDFFLDLFLNEVTKFWGLRENWLKKEFELAILQKKICIIVRIHNFQELHILLFHYHQLVISL